MYIYIYIYLVYYSQILIPRSIVNGSILSPLVVQYGHGLFASQVHS